MTESQASEILAAHNAWRRHNSADDQIEAMPVWKHFIGLMPEHRLEFTRAIEAHHGIKEQA